MLDHRDRTILRVGGGVILVQTQQPAVVREVIIDKYVQEEVAGVNSIHFLSHQSINYVNISFINIVLHIIKLS